MDTSINVTDWNQDPDWDAVVLGPNKHRHHHVGQDAEGAWYCRECSYHAQRLYIVPDAELQYMLLQHMVR